MKKIILIATVIIVTFGNTSAQRWKSERFSAALIGFYNPNENPNGNFGFGLSLSTRIFKFTSIETNLMSNTSEIYGEGNIKLYPISKTYVRRFKFSNKAIKQRIYMYINTSFDTYKEFGAGVGFGFNMNDSWRTEIRISNKTRNQKIILNPYFGIGFSRNLNFGEYPPLTRSKY